MGEDVEGKSRRNLMYYPQIFWSKWEDHEIGVIIVDFGVVFEPRTYLT